MNSRVALAVFVSLILTVAVGWFAAPDRPDPYAYAKPTAAQFDPADSAASTGSPAATTAIILAFMIAGAAGIGLAFFSPRTPKGPRLRGAPSTVKLLVDLLVERTRCGLADLHQELEVVLGLLQTVDQQIDRLVRVQAGQYAAQFVQHRGLVGVEQ